TRERGAESLGRLLAGDLLRQQVIEEVALEQRDVELATELDGVVRLAAHQDEAARVGGGNGVAQLGAVLAFDLLAQLGRPVQLDQVEAQLLALDERQRQRRQAVQADAVAAIEQKLAREEV